MRTLFIFATMMLWLAEAVAQAQPSAWFRKLDRNRDGYLQRSEVAQLRGVARVFDEADENKDGKLDPEEFIKAESLAQAAKRRPARQAAEGTDAPVAR